MPANAREFSPDRFEIARLTRTDESNAVLKRLKDAYRLCPQDDDNARELAAAELEAGDEEAAEALLRDLLRQKNMPELHRLLGKCLAVRGDYKGAAAEYQIAATMDPTETSVFDFGTSAYEGQLQCSHYGSSVRTEELSHFSKDADRPCPRVLRSGPPGDGSKTPV